MPGSERALRSTRHGSARITALGTIDVLQPERPALPAETPAIVLVYAGGVPVGRLTINGGARMTPGSVVAALPDAVLEKTLRAGLSALLANGTPAGRVDVAMALNALLVPPPLPSVVPALTLAICTRDREQHLERALASVVPSLGAGDELLVVDNASRGNTVAAVVSRYPRARVVREERPGLGWARNRAIAEFRGDVIAFCDDDCVLDERTLPALRTALARNPDVDAVAGLVEPVTLDSAAQALFDRYLANDAWYHRQWVRAPRSPAVASTVGNVGRYGTGASLSIRRRLFDRIGVFDAALGPGSLCQAGDDMEFFFRLLKSGALLLREPRVSVRHNHRVELSELEAQFEAWSGGFACAAERSMLAFPEERIPYRVLLARIALLYHARRAFQPDLRTIAIAELRAMFGAKRRYLDSRRAAEDIARDIPSPAHDAVPGFRPFENRLLPERVARRSIDLGVAAGSLDVGHDVTTVEVELHSRGSSLGTLALETVNGMVGSDRFCDAVVSRYGDRLLGATWTAALTLTRRELTERLTRVSA